MRRPLFGLLSAFLLLNACHAPMGTTTVSTKSKKAAASARPSAGASASVRASARPSIVPSAAPSVDAQLLTGLLKMDASFVVAAGGGNVIAAGGGNVIAAGGGNLIQVGGQVIAAGGGNVIAAGGGNVIAAGGGNVIAAGGGNYHLLAAPALGEMLPASGMAVVAVSLRTGEPLSEAVLTDAQGHYQLHIPKSETGNIRVVAAVPGKTKDDPVLANTKLQSELLTPAKQAQGAPEQVMDDDRTLVSRFFRRAFEGRLDDLLANDSGDPVSTGNALVDGLWTELQAAAQTIHSHTMPVADRQALAARLADNLTYYVDVSTVKSDATYPGWTASKDELAFDGYTEAVAACRVKTQQKLLETATFFDTQPYLQLHPGYTIRRPIEFCDFVIAEYLSKATSETELIPVLTSVGLDAQEAYHLKAAENGLRMAFGITLLTRPEAKASLIRLIKDGGKTP